MQNLNLKTQWREFSSPTLLFWLQTMTLCTAKQRITTITSTICPLSHDRTPASPSVK